MKKPSLRAVLLWGVGPALVFVLGAAAGTMRARAERGRFYRATAELSAADQKSLEAVPALAAANVAWALGGVDIVKATSDTALTRIPENDPARRAQSFIRFGLVDSNLDGQAALFGQACAADASACDAGLKAAAEREVQTRYVSPGNFLPLYFGGHPPIPGPDATP
jgi:hypothetical protein